MDRPELPAVHPGQRRAGGVPAGDPARLPGAGGAVRELDAAAGGDPDRADVHALGAARSEEHTSELQSLMRISYAVFCLKKKKRQTQSNSEYNSLKNTYR